MQFLIYHGTVIFTQNITKENKAEMGNCDILKTIVEKTLRFADKNKVTIT